MDEVLDRIKTILVIEDDIKLKDEVEHMINELLNMGSIPSTNSIFIDFLKLCSDVVTSHFKLLKLFNKCDYSDSQIKSYGLKEVKRRLEEEDRKDETTQPTGQSFSPTGQSVSPSQPTGQSVSPSQPCPRTQSPGKNKRRKVSWDPKLVEINLIEKQEEDEGEKQEEEIKEEEHEEWIVPALLDLEEERISEEGRRQSERESKSIRMNNLEVHRKFVPAPPLDSGREGKTTTLPLLNLERKNSLKRVDFKKIVEMDEESKKSIKEIVEDESLIDTLFAGQ